MGFLSRLIGFVMFWKPRRKVGALLFRDDRVIKQLELPVRDRYMIDKANSRAWGLHSGLLVDFEDKPHHILIEHDCAPFGLNEEKWDPEMTGIIDEQYNKAFNKIEKESIRGRAQNMIMTMALLITISIVILVLAGLMRSGRLHIPGFG